MKIHLHMLYINYIESSDSFTYISPFDIIINYVDIHEKYKLNFKVYTKILIFKNSKGWKIL